MSNIMKAIEVIAQAGNGAGRNGVREVGKTAPLPSARLGQAAAPGALFVSAYFRLLPEDRARGRYRLEARAAADAALLAPGAGSDAAGDAARRDVARVLEALGETGRLPRARGLAVFACEALNMCELIPLPSVTRTRIRIGTAFAVQELVAAERDFGTVLAVVADRAHARFFEVRAFSAAEVSGLASPATRGGRYHSDRADAPGQGEAGFHARLREELQRHYEAIGRQLAALAGGLTARGVFLAGPGNTALELVRFLPAPLAGRVVGTARLNLKQVAADVYTAVAAARERDARAAERALVAAIEEQAADGRAVNGTSATLAALERGQVRSLLVRSDVRLRGFRCGGSDRLVLAADQCEGVGTARPVEDLAAEAIDAALGQGAEVRVLREKSVASRIDGLGALLRFR
jgi:peptide subunit release factor 1 (eRF1)